VFNRGVLWRNWLESSVNVYQRSDPRSPTKSPEALRSFMEPNQMRHYGGLLADVKTRIRQAQTRAVLAVNAGLVHLYWDIGRLIADRQQQAGWGAGVIPRLAQDLRNELPEMKGFSERNIKLMVQFAREYPNAFPGTPRIGQPAVAQLPTADIASASPAVRSGAADAERPIHLRFLDSGRTLSRTRTRSRPGSSP